VQGTGLLRGSCGAGARGAVLRSGVCPGAGDLGLSQLISAEERGAAWRWAARGHEQREVLAADKGAVIWMRRWGGLGPRAASIERTTHRWAAGPVWISPAVSLGNLCIGETQLSRFMAAPA